MINDQKITNAIIRSKNTNNKNGDINEVIKSSMEVISGKSMLLDKIDEFGEFKPHVPKQGPMKDYFFIKNPLHITITLNSDITNIERIKIATTTQDGFKRERLSLEDLKLVNYDIAKSKRLEGNSTDKYIYLLNRLYSSKDYPNVIISILVKLSNEEEYINYNTTNELPDSISRIKIFYKNESLLRPFQTIGSI